MDLNKYIAVIDNYPKKGISFKDITPLIHNPEAFSSRCFPSSAAGAVHT